MSNVRFPRRAVVIVASFSLLLGLISQLPASVLLNWVLPDQIQTRNISGSIWRGSADAVRTNGITVGPVNWRLKPLALLTGNLGATIEADVPGGFFNGDVKLGSRYLTLRDVKASFALAPFTRLSSIGPSQGDVRLTIDEARFDAFWPYLVVGEMQLANLRYPPVGQQPLGSYRIQFEPVADSETTFPVAGKLTSLEGPFSVDGMLRLGDERSYSMRASVSATASADPQVARSLQILGPAKPDGSRQLVFDGNL